MRPPPIARPTISGQSSSSDDEAEAGEGGLWGRRREAVGQQGSGAVGQEGGGAVGQEGGLWDLDLLADVKAQKTPQGGSTMASPTALHTGRPCHVRCTPQALPGT